MQVLVFERIYRETKTQKPFTNLRVFTEDGRALKAVFWGEHLSFEKGDVIFSPKAVIEEYNGQEQIVLKSPLRPGTIDPVQFLPEYSDSKKVWAKKEIKAGLREIPSDLRAVINELLKATAAYSFWEAPGASTVHHNKVGGLAVHTAEVLELSLTLAEQAELSQRGIEIVIGGAVLHDLGKIWSYDTFFSRTNAEEYFGHISLGILKVSKAIDGMSNDVREYFKEVLHIILSHHGKRDWGSPVEPQTIYAHIVHLADLASSRIAVQEEKE